MTYCQDVFLPAWEKLGPTLREWGDTGLEVILPGPTTCRTVLWHHDESTFYANDWHKIHWVHNSESAMPYAKGEGVLLMVADFVSADYGWLCSPDGSQQARVLFKAGKAWDGYFTNQDILLQAQNAMDILQSEYASDNHVFIFDNAATHLKQVDMPGRCPKIPPSMARTGESMSWSSMAMANPCLARMGRSGAKKTAWGMPHLRMAGCSACIFPQIIWTHLASLRGWL